LREALTMEIALVSTAAVALLAYLFFSLIRPERF
jgi:K+-transporting ATPase KdpF subunit